MKVAGVSFGPKVCDRTGRLSKNITEHISNSRLETVRHFWNRRHHDQKMKITFDRKRMVLCHLGMIPFLVLKFIL